MRLADHKSPASRMQAGCLGLSGLNWFGFGFGFEAGACATDNQAKTQASKRNPFLRHSRAGGNPGLRFLLQWIPACAGMTVINGRLGANMTATSGKLGAKMTLINSRLGTKKTLTNAKPAPTKPCQTAQDDKKRQKTSP